MQLAQVGPPRLLPLARGALILSLPGFRPSGETSRTPRAPHDDRQAFCFFVCALTLTTSLSRNCRHLARHESGPAIPHRRHSAFEPAGYDCPAEDAVVLTGAAAPLLSATSKP